MSKMKIVDEIADTQVTYIKEALYDSVQWAIDGSELDHDKLNVDRRSDHLESQALENRAMDEFMATS